MFRGLARIVLGALAGYFTVMALSVGTTELLGSLLAVARDPAPPGWYHAIDFGYSTLAMGIGGYVAALTARHVGGPALLATAVLGLGLVTTFGGQDQVHPAWYQWLIAGLGPVVIVAAGWWRVKWRIQDAIATTT